MLDVTDQWWSAIVIAAVAGAVGGLVYDLLLNRQGDSGMIEWFSRQKPANAGARAYIDLGFLASILVGIVAAVGFLYFLTPEVRTVTSADGATSTTRFYDPFKLIAASLIVGTAGAAFITALQDRLLKVVAATNLENLSGAVQQQQNATKKLLRAASDQNDPLQPPEALQRITGQMDALSGLAESLARPVPR